MKLASSAQTQPQAGARTPAAASALVLGRLVAAMRTHRFGSEDTLQLDVGALHPDARKLLDDSLGHGEVSARVHDPDGVGAWDILETAYPGVWRLQNDHIGAESGLDLLEAGDLPQIVKAAAKALAPAAEIAASDLPAHVMNAPALLHEIRHHAVRCVADRPAHTINLSLLALNAADRACLEATFGTGPLTMLSRGFGNCRVRSTRVRNVWRVQYFNAMDTLILDTIEVVDLPAAARATAEDYAGSIARLVGLLAWMRAS